MLRLDFMFLFCGGCIQGAQRFNSWWIRHLKKKKKRNLALPFSSKRIWVSLIASQSHAKRFFPGKRFASKELFVDLHPKKRSPTYEAAISLQRLKNHSYHSHRREGKVQNVLKKITTWISELLTFGIATTEHTSLLKYQVEVREGLENYFPCKIEKNYNFILNLKVQCSLVP